MCAALVATNMDRDDIDIELRDIDGDILDLLEEGRQTRQNLASLLDVTGEYVYQRIDLLIKLGVVAKIHDGFYELADDDRGDARASDKPPAAIQTHGERDGDTAGSVEVDSGSETGTEYDDVELPTSLVEEIERYEGQLERSGTDKIDARVRAAEAVGRMLVAEDGVSRSDAQEELLPQLGIDGVGKDTWWQRAGKDRFGRVDEIQWSQTEQQYVFDG